MLDETCDRQIRMLDAEYVHRGVGFPTWYSESESESEGEQPGRASHDECFGKLQCLEMMIAERGTSEMSGHETATMSQRKSDRPVVVGIQTIGLEPEAATFIAQNIFHGALLLSNPES